MKRLLTLALAIIPLLSIAQDDMYFSPSKKDKKVSRTQATVTAVTTQVAPATIVDYKSNTRSDDEYNRRYSNYNGNYNYTGELQPGDTLVARIDTVYEYDINDDEIDYRFSRRLVRFHNPRFYALGSPYYWDLYYGYGAWDYLYDPYDPWYWHYGWGYGWTWGPWDCWYGGIWGWHHPYAWSYWGWGPGWHHDTWVSHGGGGFAHHNQNYRPRGEFAKTPGRSGGMSPSGMAGRNIQRFSASNNGASAFRGRTDKVSPAQYIAQQRGESSSMNSRGRGTYSDYAASRRGNSEGVRQQQHSEGVSNRESFANRNRGGYSSISSNRSYQNNNQSSRSSYNNSTPRNTYNDNSTRSSSNNSTRSSSTNSSVSRSSSSFGGFSGSGSRSGGGSFGGGGGSFGGGGSRGGGGGHAGGGRR